MFNKELEKKQAFDKWWKKLPSKAVDKKMLEVKGLCSDYFDAGYNAIPFIDFQDSRELTELEKACFDLLWSAFSQGKQLGAKGFWTLRSPQKPEPPPGRLW